MGWLGNMIDRDNRIIEDLYKYPPGEREAVLMVKYGRMKEEFGEVDFGDDQEAIGEEEYDNTDGSDDDELKPDIADTDLMSKDQIWELGRAGIDLFEFDLMDNDERIEALEDAGLDPDDFEW